MGLPVPYPDIVAVTDMTVMSIDKKVGRLRIDKLMPGVDARRRTRKHRLPATGGPRRDDSRCPGRARAPDPPSGGRPDGIYLKG